MRGVRVAKGDVRIGGFVFHPEEGFVKVSDLGGFFTHRVSTLCVKGRMLAMAVAERRDDYLLGYASTMHNVLGVVPDVDWFKEINASCQSCYERHPELYVSPQVDGEDDLEVAKGRIELDKEVKDALETGGEAPASGETPA